MKDSPKTIRTLFTVVTCLLYTGMFFPGVNVTNIFTVLLLALCLINTTPKEIWITLKQNTFAQLLVGIFLLQVLGLLYTTNLKTGLFMLEKKIFLVAFPVLVLPVFRKIKDDDNLLIKAIGWITLLSSVILLCIATYRKFVLGDPHAFFFESFRGYEGFTSIHYVYYSIYFTCGSLLWINSLFNITIRKPYNILIIVFAFIYSLAITILVASKTGIIMFVAASFILLHFRINNKKLFALSIGLGVIFLSLLLFFNDTTRLRFEGLDQHLSILAQEELTEELQATGLSIRLLFWKISLTHLWRDHHVVTGMGTGDAQDYINSLYNLPQYQLYGFINWDSHNQWVFALIQLGIAGVFVLALLCWKSFKAALATRDLNFLCFLVIILGFSLSECILELNKGIIFVALMYTLLCASYSRTESSQERRGLDR